MLLLNPVPTSADAGPDLCTLCPDLCTLHPDLWTLCLWCFPSFNWCKYSTCTGGGCHQLQLALVVLFHSATSADSPLAHVMVSPSATCAGGAFSSIHWHKYCTCTRATCTVWWWSVVVVYIHTYIYAPTSSTPTHRTSPQPPAHAICPHPQPSYSVTQVCVMVCFNVKVMWYIDLWTVCYIRSVFY